MHMITTDPIDKIELRNLDEQLLMSMAHTVLLLWSDFKSISDDMLDDDDDDDDDVDNDNDDDEVGIEGLKASLSLYTIGRL